MTLDRVAGGNDDTGGVAPGDIAAPHPAPTQQRQQQPLTTTSSSAPHPAMPTPIPPHLHPTPDLATAPDTPLRSSAPTPIANAALLSHPSRAHQFLTNPPLTLSQINPTDPFRQFNNWFRDARLPASSAPETCTLATAALPSGRVSARTLYLKELDERGWVVYSNWGSRKGKGGQVFGTVGGRDEWGWDGGRAAGDEQQRQGNRWAALTFHWQAVERQVRIEGIVESLSREESETYWRTRERGSQIGAWASQQSRVLWETEPLSESASASAPSAGVINGAENADADAAVINKHDIVDDGRSILEDRVKEMEARFADVEEIPLPPFWGGIRIVPESVEFWQGRKSRLHDRFRYVRIHGEVETGVETAKTFQWKIQRLSP
ncbi:pyridoxamine 5'-phosphate oxidase [Histoplasma capsulatum var. duboisii H88]|uniref:pyridoxal 5'-phosphate synthase n=1 Tax=Ajellomyces capsulatus (strain H88) TaxID=544711 RepID=F0UN60_AJEC8|nr:pyridoxamine 5'-phosphate oxidase [Histoplasma capsulatum var. duboisii H88]